MKNDYIKQVSVITGDSIEQTEMYMEKLRTEWGISYKEYYTNGFHTMTETQRVRHAKRMKRRKEDREVIFNRVIENSGMSKKEILSEIKNLNSLGIFKIGIIMYDKWELYRLTEEQKKAYLAFFSQRAEIKKRVEKKLISIDAGELSCDALEEDYRACYEINQKIMTDELEKQISDLIIMEYPELSNDSEECKRIAIDIETNRFLLGFSYKEYLLYGFRDKDLDERRSFLSGKERRAVFRKINPEESRDLFDNKHFCYQRLKKYFRRGQVLIETEKDYPLFKEFCSGKKLIVKKPMVDAMGRGVEPVHLTEDTDLEFLMKRLLDDNGPFVAEELIRMHKRMKKICPDSVNTVRFETYYNDGNPVISAVFMRMGKGGTFVDNGSAGGIMVSVDPFKGKIIANGCDTYGNRYTFHPSTGIKLVGYKLPHWRNAVRLARKLAMEVPEMQYIGWDLTCNHRGQWIVVEGNAMPQGHQSSLRKGIRKAFYDTLGKNPNAFKEIEK